MLALVAFVLGFLIMLLLINRQDDAAAAAQALAPWAPLAGPALR
ncbi:hypothetical protein [Cellulomonas oligotrophica]|uniref:Uncharacterized protein n=1 Tax=Cellulomonas oligotrophica TaxID=931536 RepID=A0A7Y9FDD3_9CELL|nr:hypothetical protein [Cellulomonas oligotrophica]NYD85140.1 hypothetical protein [Cellulomonas oligotrophica]GIG33844.1 hypothetical protein Col01nite_30030 [Cellulomonas oligotrophica]